MSLDVSLILPDTKVGPGSGIFVREDGGTREISRAEWDEKFPGREPVVVEYDDDYNEIYTANITHNLNRMAGEAGIYKHLWRPEEIGIQKAEQLTQPLEEGLRLLESDPQRFKEFNPPNGWGDYEGLVRFVRNYLQACREHPRADVRACR